MPFSSNPYYSVITIDHTKLIGTVSDFLFFLDDLPADAYASIHSTGKDIRFSDATGTTELAFDIRAIDTSSGTCDIMVRVPSVSSVGDTEILIWYGDHGLSLYADTDTYGRNAVYAGKTQAFGLHESLGGATGASIYMDRTGNGYDGLDYVSSAPTSRVGGACEFNPATNDCIEIVSSWTPVFPISISGWIRPDVITLNINIYTSHGTTGTPYGVRIRLMIGKVAAEFWDGTGNTTSDLNRKTGGTTLTPGSWYHFSCVIRGANDITIYLNGSDDGGTYLGSGTTIAGNPTLTARIGCLVAGASEFDGGIDEILVEESEIAEEYVYATYQNQLVGYGSFYTVGPKTSNISFTPLINWY